MGTAGYDHKGLSRLRRGLHPARKGWSPPGSMTIQGNRAKRDSAYLISCTSPAPVTLKSVIMQNKSQACRAF